MLRESLKGNAKSKKSTTSLDLKGSKFKPLRGISEDIVSELLQHLYQKKISIVEMAQECTSRKQLQKVQSAFVKGTNCSSWDEAVSRYPSFATAEQLEPFKALNFSTKLPEVFLKFCQRVTK